MRRVTDDDRQTPTTVTSLHPTLCVGGAVIIERVVKSRLIDHLTSNKLLNPHSLPAVARL